MLLHYLIECLFTSKQCNYFTVIIHIWETIRELGQGENFSSLLLLVLFTSVLPNLVCIMAELLKNNGKARAARHKNQYSPRLEVNCLITEGK